MTDLRRMGGTLALTLCVCLTAGCSDSRVRMRIDESGPPVRGGTLELVGSSDVDHLATTSAYLMSSIWLIETFARQLLAYAPGPDDAVKTRPVADLALEVPTRENGAISADGLSYAFHLRRGVRWDSDPPREVTAHDVVRAFKLFCNPVSPVGAPTYYTGTIAGMADYCERFAHVPGTVAAIGDYVTSTTLSDPQLKRRLFRLVHPVQVSGKTDEEQAGEYLLNERADVGKRQAWAGAWVTPLALEKGAGHGADDHVMLPPGIRPSLEVIEPEFGRRNGRPKPSLLSSLITAAFIANIRRPSSSDRHGPNWRIRARHWRGRFRQELS